MARPQKPIDAEQVELLASIHCTNEEIAIALGCSPDTLTRRFADALKKGKAEGKASLRRKQWELAQAGNPTMLIWLGKQLLEQKDKAAHEHSGPNGGAIEFSDHEAAAKLAAILNAARERKGKE